MFVEPADLDQNKVLSTVQETWGLRLSELRYEPVGFGSHHYSGVDDEGLRWFVNVDDLDAKGWIVSDTDSAFDDLESAFRAAVVLRTAGLEFVHAPIESDEGVVLAQVDERYVATLFPFIDGTSGHSNDDGSVEGRRLLLEAMGRLHADRRAMDETPIRRDTLRVPRRGQLMQSLDQLDTTWRGGPYSEPARQMLAKSASGLTSLLDQYDDLTDVALNRADEWVVTHGEPHPGNVMRSRGGQLLLIDWDTVAIGPRERDLWMIEPRDAAEWSAYTSKAPSPELDPSTLELYRLWWRLAEISVFTHQLRSQHEDDANTRIAWRELRENLPAER